MINTTRRIKKCAEAITILLSVLIISTLLFGIEADQNARGKSVRKTDFDLTVKEDLITLKARDASLKEILEEIGREMGIEVVATIPVEDKITLEFDMLPLEDALKRFKTNYALVTDSKRNKGKITKMLVVPTGTEIGQYPHPTAKSEERARQKPEEDDPSIGDEKRDQKTSSRPEPFKFEFDPSQFSTDKKPLKE